MKPVTLKKITAGSYEYVYPDGTVAKVENGFVDDYSRIGMWIITTLNASRTDILSYSDPIRTKRDCVAAIQDKVDNPEKYGAKWVVSATPQNTEVANWRCPHCDEGYLRFNPQQIAYRGWKTCKVCSKEYILDFKPLCSRCFEPTTHTVFWQNGLTCEKCDQIYRNNYRATKTA